MSFLKSQNLLKDLPPGMAQLKICWLLGKRLGKVMRGLMGTFEAASLISRADNMLCICHIAT